MSSVELRNKTQKTVFDGTEWVFIQNSSDPFLVQKISLSDLRGATGEVVGASIKTFSKLIPISPTFPWFCLSYPDVDFTTANYSTEFINELRSRKYIYNEFNDPMLSPRAESFTGAWASNVFTLDNNTANNAMLAELAEDWLYHGSPSSNWRILNDGVIDFNITGINVTSRTITVNLDSETATGTSVELYTNRVYRDATKARHFSEAGLATYQAGGGKSGRLFRRDQMQGWQLGATADTSGPRNYWGCGGSRDTAHGIVASVNRTSYAMSTLLQGASQMLKAMDDGTNGTPRTGTETIAKSSSRYEYIYVGSYTA